jgi:hypothetical protein
MCDNTMMCSRVHMHVRSAWHATLIDVTCYKVIKTLSSFKIPARESGTPH